MTVQALYDKSLKNGLSADATQAAAVKELDVLLTNLQAKKSKKGAYLFGPVGRGKSHVMQYLFDAAQTQNIPTRRVHFHKFMEELHERMHKLGKMNGKDPMRQLAEDIAEDAQLLCFDEFYITNIADAMLLGRLMEHLFGVGITVCATSNWPMDDLFQGGLNRDRFKPFITLMQQYLNPIELAGEIDYRSQNTEELPLWRTGSHPKWLNTSLKFYGEGRKAVHIPEFPKPEKTNNTAALFTFENICGDGVGRSEYLDLSETLTTLLITNIPILPPSHADAALRFITLVDVWYEAKKRLICTSEALPSELCPAGDASAPFARTASRIHEMQGW